MHSPFPFFPMSVELKQAFAGVTATAKASTAEKKSPPIFAALGYRKSRYSAGTRSNRDPGPPTKFTQATVTTSTPKKMTAEWKRFMLAIPLSPVQANTPNKTPMATTSGTTSTSSICESNAAHALTCVEHMSMRGMRMTMVTRMRVLPSKRQPNASGMDMTPALPASVKNRARTTTNRRAPRPRPANIQIADIPWS